MNFQSHKEKKIDKKTKLGSQILKLKLVKKSFHEMDFERGSLLNYYSENEKFVL